jgi:acetolactate synthase-1/2/3 large subunit
MACPDRKVVCLEADGSAMYNLQSLWTHAREGLDITTVIFNNRSYAILNLELNRVGAVAPGSRARDMLDLRRPDLDFVALAKGMGLQASRAETAEHSPSSSSGPSPSPAARDRCAAAVHSRGACNDPG